MTINRRKDKTLFGLWLTKAEESSLFESLKLLQKEDSNSKLYGYAMSNIVDIIQTAYENGDLNKR